MTDETTPDVAAPAEPAVPEPVAAPAPVPAPDPTVAASPGTPSEPESTGSTPSPSGEAETPAQTPTEAPTPDPALPVPPAPVAAPPAGAIDPDGGVQRPRTDDDVLVGQFATIVDGPYADKYVVYQSTVESGKDGYPTTVLVKTRDERDENLVVEYEHLRPATPGGR